MSFIRIPCGSISRISISRLTSNPATSIPIHQLKRQFLPSQFRHASTRAPPSARKPLPKPGSPKRSPSSQTPPRQPSKPPTLKSTPKLVAARPPTTTPRASEPLVLYYWPLSRSYRFWAWMVFGTATVTAVTLVWSGDYDLVDHPTLYLSVNMIFGVLLLFIGGNFLSNPRAVASKVSFTRGVRGQSIVSVEMRRMIPFMKPLVAEAELRDVSVNTRFAATAEDLKVIKALRAGEADGARVASAPRGSGVKRAFADLRLLMAGSPAELRMRKGRFGLAEHGQFLDGGEGKGPVGRNEVLREPY
ncbi:hypothetical protein P152DRAFT_455942 [Eremomyces bilateralis CBS 781.70]|uniref:Uncharacterized protein n=1 Tax=Eremomyces bilateralis CBS 781.70 TaxID=1392243 RepID=A0A6G1GAG7_9PEZI|nr:uncharacterized protein P152DRAFT_455942 [Eremomyces bilateralis CBS 781.70]KAF1814901.1 hypothetical protein P152DRAFT_455942 [Eremomyces bilateralis CBS 781.70]